MRREGDLWADVISIQNLRLAHQNARRGKAGESKTGTRARAKAIAMVDSNPDLYLGRIRDDLMHGRFKTSEYRITTRMERGKERKICDLPYYPDRIVHWAVMQIVSPILLGSCIEQTFSAIPGRGAHLALRYERKYLRDPKVRYCLTADIRKCFESFPKDIVKSRLRRRLKDPMVLRLLDQIVDEYPGPGLPLGNVTSQVLANYTLSGIDHHMKEVCKTHYYLRYMDDFRIYGYSKAWLHAMRKILEEQINALGMQMKGDYQVFPIEDRGVYFVGYRMWPKYTLLRKSTVVRMKRGTADIRKKYEASGTLDAHDLGRIASYKGILDWGSCHNLYVKVLKDLDEAAQAQFAAERAAKHKYVVIQ